MASHPTRLWLIVNHDGLIIHQTSDPSHVDLMERYVRKSREVGDDWALVQYAFEKVVSIQPDANKVAS